MNPVTAPRTTARHLPIWAGLVLAIIGGLMMPIQGRINGGLAERMGDANAAAAISFAGGTVVMLLTSVLLPRGRRASSRPRGLRDVTAARTLRSSRDTGQIRK